MISNKTNSSYFSKRIKSPYVMQYLAFQERINAPPKRRHPLMMSNQINNQQNKVTKQEKTGNTLEEVKDFIKKKHDIWLEEKENLPSVEDEHITNIKERIERIKNRQGNTMQPTPQDSQVFSRQKTMTPSTAGDGVRSRAISQNCLRVRAQSKKRLVNFIQYKKDRKEFSSKLKRY